MAETVKKSIKTTGMHCRSCAMLIEMNVGDLDGVEAVSVDLEGGKTEIEFDPEVVDADRIAAEIVEAGYGVDPTE